VFDDPFHLDDLNRVVDGEQRRHVIGMAGDTLLVLFVVTPTGAHMAKKRSASSPREKLVVKSGADIRAYTKSAAYRTDLERARSIRDSEIEYSDVSALTDEELERMVRARATRLQALKTSDQHPAGTGCAPVAKARRGWLSDPHQ
jgi:hypothetical protein